MTIITNLTGNVSSATWNAPAQRVTIVDRQNNRFPRNVTLTPDGLMVSKSNYSIGIPIQELLNIAGAKDANLTWPPYFLVQPSNVSVVGPNIATFSVSVSSELALTYQWQKSSDNGGNYSNVANSAPYQNIATNALTINTANNTLNGYYYRVFVVNGSGNNTSNFGKLTVT